MKTTQITHIDYDAIFKPAKHTLPKRWDSSDTDMVIFLVLVLGTVIYFGYGLLN